MGIVIILIKFCVKTVFSAESLPKSTAKRAMPGFYNEMSRRIQGDRDEKDIKQVKRNKGNNTKKYQKNTSRKEAVYKESDNMSDETQLAAEKRISGETADKDEYVNMNTEVSLGNFGDSDTAEPKKSA